MFFADESGVRSACRDDLGDTRENPLSATLANAFISICCLRSRPKANCGS